MAIQVVSYRCTLSNRVGRVISSTVALDVLLHPEAGDMPLKALSEGMRYLRKGERRTIELRAEQAYGLYDPTLAMTSALEDSDFKTPPKLGQQVRLIRDGRSLPARVTALTGDSITLDANHPLAGQDLIFVIEALETREATAIEIAEYDLPDTSFH